MVKRYPVTVFNSKTRAKMRETNAQEIYDELPAKLRADLLLHRYKEIVEKASILLLKTVTT